MSLPECELLANSILPGRPLWHKVALGALIIFIIVAILLRVSLARTSPLKGASADVAIAVERSPPSVEPLVLKQVSPATAQKINAAVPLTSAAIPAAAPFIMHGTQGDKNRATDCLASALYYEAAAERPEGQMAVAQVVLNRVRHPAYPKTVCGVVYQGQERTTGCQFSFSCDGSMARTPSGPVWERVRITARSMLSGTVYAPVGWATHYHTDWVLPVWSAKLDKVRVEASHLFFRWSGAWGTPRAFRGIHAGDEPNIPKLASFSEAHLTDSPAGDGVDLSLDTPPASSNRIVFDSGNGEFIIEISQGADPSFLPILAEKTCGNRDYCKIIAWANPARMPSSFPVGESELSSAVFSFLRNRREGFEKPLWNCAHFVRPDRKQCMRKRVVLESNTEHLIPAAPDMVAPLPSSQIPQDASLSHPPLATEASGRRRPGT